MKTYLRVLGFAKPIEKYAIPYFFYTLLHAVFNTFTLVMVMPLLNTLFKPEEQVKLVTELPPFKVSIDYVMDLFNYLLYTQYGEYDTMEILILVAALLVVSAMLNNLFRYLSQRVMESMRLTTMRKIRDATYDNVMDMNVGFFTNERKGDIISKITSDVQVIQYCISNTLQVVFRDPFLIIGYMVALFAISTELTLFSAIYLPIVGLIIGVIVKRLRTRATQGQEVYGSMVSLLEESLSGTKVIKAYGITNMIKTRFHSINQLYTNILWSMAKRQQLASPMSEFLGILAAAGLLIYGGHLVLDGALGAAAFITFLGMFTQLTRPIRSFTDAFANINQGIAAGERVFTLLDAQSNIVEKEDAVEMKELKNSVKFKDVRFTYDVKEVIKGISFEVKRGETVALVGPSGGGKSTLADLLPRFYDVTQGAIEIDGTDIRDYTLDSIYDHIGVVSQDTVLFNDSVENNLRMAKQDATMEEMIKAAKIANAHEFIEKMDDGYQTNIGERGMRLSGGQRQRLSIARAVLKNPDILILDEATSALDTESEKLVQQSLEKLLEGRTSVVIAHRLSTIHSANKILVIDDGRIVEQGTHDELLKKEGVYYKLVALQNIV